MIPPFFVLVSSVLCAVYYLSLSKFLTQPGMGRAARFILKEYSGCPFDILNRFEFY